MNSSHSMVCACFYPWYEFLVSSVYAKSATSIFTVLLPQPLSVTIGGEFSVNLVQKQFVIKNKSECTLSSREKQTESRLTSCTE